MNDTAPKWMGVLSVSALFGVVGAGVAMVMYDYGIAGAGLIFLLVFLLVAVVLMLGWREPAPHVPAADPHRAGEAPTAREAMAAKPVAAAAAPKAAAAAAPVATETVAEPAPVKPTAPPAKPVEAKPSTAAASKAAAPATASVAAADGPGSKPETLDAPREGGADNLKEIKGVGPKLEQMLHGMGFYHFDQIAGWGPQEVAWVDQNLEGFKGRVTRDDWVAQARLLASGGETDFSKKVGKGEVY